MLTTALLLAGCCILGSNAVNHWALSKEGTIQAHIESPYYLKRPEDLSAFVRQTDYLNLIGLLNAKLLHIKTELIKKMEQSNSYTIDFMYQTECIITFFLQDNDLYSTVKSQEYLNRITSMGKKAGRNAMSTSNGIAGARPPTPDQIESLRNAMPVCEDVKFCMSCMEHLESMANRTRLDMKPEHSLSNKDLMLFSGPQFVEQLNYRLRSDSLAWRWPLLSSYFWRARGSAPKAMACARRALWLSPRKYRDTALLSLGTVLQRANRTQDALVVLLAARDHAPIMAENHIAAGNALFLVAEFNRSMQAFDVGVRMDDSYADRDAHIRKSMTCFRFIKTKLRQIEQQLVDMRTDLAAFVREKTQLNEYYAKMLEQQVPIAERLAEDRSFDNYSHQLLHRSQYCAVRQTKDDGEPVLSCDFYSELQMQLNKDTTIDTIQNYIDTKTDFIRNQWELSLGVYKNLDIENYEGAFDAKVAMASGAGGGGGGGGGVTSGLDDETQYF